MMASTHRDLASALRSMLPILFRWGASEWAWRAVVVVANEAEWRKGQAFSVKDLEMLRTKARDTGTLVVHAGNLSARIMQILEKDPREIVKLSCTNILSNIAATAEEKKGEAIHAALEFILDCCERDIVGTCEEFASSGLIDETERKRESASLSKNGEKIRGHSKNINKQPSDSYSEVKLHLSPALVSILATINMQIHLLSDVTLYRLFLLVINMKPLIIQPARATLRTNGPPLPYRIPSRFTTLLTDLIVCEYSKRLQSSNFLTATDCPSSELLICKMFSLLSQLPTFHSLDQKHLLLKGNLITACVPKLLHRTSTINDAIHLWKGVIMNSDSLEAKELAQTCLLEVIRRVGIKVFIDVERGFSTVQFVATASCYQFSRKS